MATLKANGGGIIRWYDGRRFSVLALCKNGRILRRDPWAGGYRRFAKLKDGVTPEQFIETLESRTDVIINPSIPSLRTLKQWSHDGVSEAVDGCEGIEPDGYCPHGQPSWLLALGFF